MSLKIFPVNELVYSIRRGEVFISFIPNSIWFDSPSFIICVLSDDFKIISTSPFRRGSELMFKLEPSSELIEICPNISLYCVPLLFPLVFSIKRNLSNFTLLPPKYLNKSK